MKWIPAITSRYHVGIDGISLPLFVLTFVLSFLCAIYTWRFVPKPGSRGARNPVRAVWLSTSGASVRHFDQVKFASILKPLLNLRS